ncbi:MAG: hypothetical protein HOI35_07595 [Woeseia sp.]|jgi:hypothetical protein|nr:hypothetical protein [Woeseia sp.]MBT6209868.1 hypothetical protein [Woeseia sp.]
MYRKLFILFLMATPGAFAAEVDFAGAWRLNVVIPAEPLVGLLELEMTDSGWIAWVEGGPTPVTISGQQIELLIDSRDRQGYLFQRKLTGQLDNGKMTGVMTSIDVVETAAEFGEDRSVWTAVPYVFSATEFPIAEPRMLKGIWVPLRGVDFRKWSTAMTPAAIEWLSGYDARMDEPQKRCVSPGLYSAVTWSFPFEIVVDDDKIVMLYEAFNLMRRVFTDGRDDPGFYPNSSMGYSTGTFENGELIIETKLLTHTIRDFNGEPISENATISERYRLSDDGNRLSVILTLNDRENYDRPSIRRRVWTRQNDVVIFPFECDPDAFFRQLYNEGRMQEYINRTPRRP